MNNLADADILAASQGLIMELKTGEVFSLQRITGNWAA